MIDPSQVPELRPKVGRRPKRADPDATVTMTIRIPGQTKNRLVDLAEGYDMTMAETIEVLVANAV